MKRLISVVYLLIPIFMDCSEVKELVQVSEAPTTPTTPNSQPIKIPVRVSAKLPSEEFTRSVFACSSKATLQKTSELLKEENPLEKAMRNFSPDNKTPEGEKSENSTAATSDGEDGIFPLDLEG